MFCRLSWWRGGLAKVRQVWVEASSGLLLWRSSIKQVEGRHGKQLRQRDLSFLSVLVAEVGMMSLGRVCSVLARSISLLQYFGRQR